MTLYGRTGESFGLELLEWQEALQVARDGGFEPGGSGRPPMPLDRTWAAWDGSLEAPEGQTVTAPDARALAARLRQAAPERFGCLPADKASELARFCASGPFVMVADTAHEGRREAERARRALRLPGGGTWARAAVLKRSVGTVIVR